MSMILQSLRSIQRKEAAKKRGCLKVFLGMCPHIWHVDGNGHDAAHWRNSLYRFAQLIFR